MSPTSEMPGGTADQGPAPAIAQRLKHAQRILLVTHEHPDGDGIGSTLALRLALVAHHKTVVCAAPQPCPAKYRFLTGSEHLVVQVEPTGFDCAVALDCDGPGRLAHLQSAFSSAVVTVDIDHHQAECAFGDVRWCDPQRAATGLMVYELLHVMACEITAPMATCLYAAIAADTGVFRFQNTSVEALSVAAQLVAAGADPAAVATRVAEQLTLPKAALLGRALCSMALYDDGALVVATLNRSDYADCGASPEHTDGLIDELKRLEGVQVVALLREETPDHWRVSLRSVEADVAAVCRQFGGGGHRLAAGCQMRGTQDEVRRRVVEAAQIALAATRP